MKKIVALLFVLMNFGALSLTASADTLTLQSGPFGGPVNNVYTYPYTFTLTGVAGTVQLMCIDFAREITVGESWPVNISNITSTDPLAFKEDAILYSEILNTQNTTTIEELQYAAWQVLDSGASSGNTSFDDIAEGYAAAAKTEASTPGAFNYSGYVLFTPAGLVGPPDYSDDATGPQRFIGYFPGGGITANIQPFVATPEPSSLILLGTGVIGVAGMLRRRAVRAVQA